MIERAVSISAALGASRDVQTRRAVDRRAPAASQTADSADKSMNPASFMIV
jgi:hypothetical protein